MDCMTNRTLRTARQPLVALGWLLTALLLVPALIGCGGGPGDGKYSLEGKVTYKGQLVPRGQIIFAPDSSKQNQGPGSVAPIEQGRYATYADKGIIGGPYRIRIEGFDGVASGDNIDGSPLFQPYEIEIDLPKENATRDFEVPGK